MNQPGSPIRFVLDEQLGKLARWLRILGQDVIYKNRFEDREIIELAREENRLILTRDSQLKNLAGDLPLYLVKENYPALQLPEVVKRFKDKMGFYMFSRCVECNQPLNDIPKEQVAGKVPPYVFKTQENFRHCTVCDKYFWSATHGQHIEFVLKELLGDDYPEVAVEVKEKK